MGSGMESSDTGSRVAQRESCHRQLPGQASIVVNYCQRAGSCGHRCRPTDLSQRTMGAQMFMGRLGRPAEFADVVAFLGSGRPVG